MNNALVFGMFATVKLKYEFDIKKLGLEISKGLVLPNFNFETDEDFPHDIVGYSEALGFEIFLKESSSVDGFRYCLQIETEHAIMEKADNRMYDLSPWLARYVYDVCKIETKISET